MNNVINFNEKGKYTQIQLIRIGNNVASLWGGDCLEVTYRAKTNDYLFTCVEYGEEFYTVLKLEEMEKYNY